MFFILSKILWFFVAPFNLGLSLLTGAMIAMYLKRAQLARVCGIAAWCVLIVFGVLPTGQLMMRSLESQYSVPTDIKRVNGIIMLGGVMDTDIGLSRGNAQMISTADRLTTFVALGRQYAGAKMVFTSGQGSIAQDGVPEGQMVRDALSALGFKPGQRLVIEDQSRNTWENAVLSKDLVKPKDGQTWLLVTSASHMPRAVGVFKKAGWDVLPYPSDYVTAGPGGKTVTTFLTNMQMSHTALKEYIGIAVYALTGKWSTEDAKQ